MPKNWHSGESSKRISYESLSSWSPSSKADTGKQQLNLSNYLEMTFPRGQQLSSLCRFVKSPFVRYRGWMWLIFSISQSKRKTYRLFEMWSWNSWSFLMLLSFLCLQGWVHHSTYSDHCVGLQLHFFPMHWEQ